MFKDVRIRGAPVLEPKRNAPIPPRPWKFIHEIHQPNSPRIVRLPPRISKFHWAKTSKS